MTTVSQKLSCRSSVDIYSRKSKIIAASKQVVVLCARPEDVVSDVAY